MTICSSPQFFDYIEGTPCSFFERMFYFPGISEKFGCRKFSIIRKKTNGDILIKESKAHKHTLKSVILTIIQIASCLILFPLLICKAFFRANYTFKIITDKTSTAALQGEPLVRLSKEEAQKQLDNAWDAYTKEIHEKPYEINYGLLILQPNEQDSYSTICPDQVLGNIIKPFEEDPNVHFIPSTYYLDPRDSESILITSESGLCDLISHLRAAFVLGKNMVVGRYSNGKHSVAVAFQADGQFRIIDSMFSSTVSLENITSRLNQECILGANGNVIDFSGEYVNTRIQKSGNECMRFATLYAYQIARKRDLDAYQDVNGAFAEGRLQVFKDYQSVDGSKRLEDASAIPKNMYKSFMQSWAYRTAGYTVNHWDKIKINEIVENYRIENDHMEVLQLQKDKHPKTYPLSTTGRSFSDGTIKMYLEKNQKKKKVIPTECSTDRTLGSFIPTDDGLTIILYHQSLKQPISVHLRKEEALTLCFKKSENTWREEIIKIDD